MINIRRKKQRECTRKEMWEF